MRSDIIVRAASRADIATITAWQVAMAKETEGINLDIATVTRGVTHVFDTPTTGYYLIAEKGTKASGCMLVLSEWSDWRAGTVLWLHSVYIEPELRNLGIFKALYEHVKNQVTTDKTLCGIRLYVDKSNKIAATAYRNLGLSSEHYELMEWMPQAPLA